MSSVKTNFACCKYSWPYKFFWKYIPQSTQNLSFCMTSTLLIFTFCFIAISIYRSFRSYSSERPGLAKNISLLYWSRLSGIWAINLVGFSSIISGWHPRHRRGSSVWYMEILEMPPGTHSNIMTIFSCLRILINAKYSGESISMG